jgi:hypothetical protein
MLTLLFACEKQIDIDLQDPDPVLAIEGQVTDQDTIQFVRLSYIQNYNSTELPDFAAEKNAIVKLFEDDVEVGLLSFNDSTERFEIQFKGTVDHSYNIEVVTEDGTKYISEPEVINFVGPIDSLWSVKEDDIFSDEQIYNIKMNTFETPGIGDNYQWKIYVNGEYQSAPNDITTSDDNFVDGQPILNIDIYEISEKEYEEFQIKSPDGRVFVRIDQTAITKSYFDFLNEVITQTVIVGGPFDPPAAGIRGNVYKSTDINDRALGYFQAVSVESASTEVLP